MEMCVNNDLWTDYGPNLGWHIWVPLKIRAQTKSTSWLPVWITFYHFLFFQIWEMIHFDLRIFFRWVAQAICEWFSPILVDPPPVAQHAAKTSKIDRDGETYISTAPVDIGTIYIYTDIHFFIELHRSIRWLAGFFTFKVGHITLIWRNL